MAKRKKPSEKSLGAYKGPRVVLHIPPELAERLEAYLAKVRPETTQSAVIRYALDRFLAESEASQGK